MTTPEPALPVPAARDRGRPRLRGWRAAVGYVGYPFVLGATLVATWLALAYGVAPMRVTFAVIASAVVVVGIIEHLQPYGGAWGWTATSLRVDTLHSIVSAVGIAPYVRAAAAAGVVAIGGLLETDAASASALHSLPMGAQVVGCVLAADLGAYAGHRWMHLTRLGWRIHAVHHTPTAMNFIAAGRTHPFNAVVTLGLESLVLFALGAGPELLAYLGVWKAVNGLLQHANIDLRPGWLSTVLATNEAHWLHHSVVRAHSDTNFGNATMVWDRVFGTFRLPRDRAAPLMVGIDNAAIPEAYLTHLTIPFALQRHEFDQLGQATNHASKGQRGTDAGAHHDTQ